MFSSSTFRPRRGRGRKKRKKKKQNRTEDKPDSFEWEAAFSGSGHANGIENSNSTLISLLVPVGAIRTPPGSGAGLIPLYLPRQEKMANQELNQLNSQQRRVFASFNLSMALSFYDIQISSDYRLFSKILPLFLSKKN